ncbi:hypothetical protein Tco_0528379 [Tanacetum coccineum]
MSWGWRKVLQLCPFIRDFVRFSIGDGATASVWFDWWNEGGPLANTISTRDIFRSVLDLFTKARDIVVNGVWNWPLYLSTKYPFLNLMVVPNIVVNTLDRLVWQNSLGVVKPFSVAQVWSLLHPRNPKVPWSSKSVIAKLVVAALAYFVWQEQNNRLFKNNKRTATQLIACIMSSVRLKLLSCCFKKLREGVRLAHMWSLHDTWCITSTTWGKRYLDTFKYALFELPRGRDEKLIQKLLLNQKCMGYLVHAYYNVSPTSYYKDDSCCSADLKSNTTEDIISIGSFVCDHSGTKQCQFLEMFGVTNNVSSLNRQIPEFSLHLLHLIPWTVFLDHHILQFLPCCFISIIKSN